MQWNIRIKVRDGQVGDSKEAGLRERSNSSPDHRNGEV